MSFLQNIVSELMKITIFILYSATTPVPEDPCQPDCSNPADDGTRYPYPQNCTYFYECKFNITELYECLSDSQFNPTTLECDDPQSAGCTPDPDFVC